MPELEKQEQITVNTQEENSSREVDNNYLDVINNLKANSVDKDEYNRVVEENKRILDAYVNGSKIEGYDNEEVKVDVNELRSSLYGENNGELSNLEYVEKTLALRDELIRQGEADPFLPLGQKIAPTDEDIACANKVADALRDCVEYANGDSAIFTNELQRIMVDTPLPRRRR